METQRYLQLYITESGEHLAKIDEEIAALVENPRDSGTLAELYRHAHSLKGMSATMGFKAVVDVSHRIEDILSNAKNDPSMLTPALLTRIGRAFEGVSRLVGMIERGETLPGDIGPWLAPLEDGEKPPATSDAVASRVDSSAPRRRDRSTAAPTPTQPAPGAGAGPDSRRYRIELRFSEDAPMPSARAAVALRRIEARASVLEADPEPAVLARGEFGGRLTVTVLTADAGTLGDDLGRISDVEHVEIRPLEKESAAGQALAAAGGGSPVESLAPEAGASVPAEEEVIAAAEAVLMGAENEEDGAGGPESARSGAGRPVPLPAASRSLRVGADRLDRFLEGVGELIVQGGRIERSLRGHGLPSAADQVERLRRTTDRLNREVLEMRLLPFHTIAHRFVRSVHELSTSLGREALLRIEGREVRLDRAILDELVDPINHIVRNAVGHGIEDPPERTALGKPPHGTILIALSRKGDGVTIRVSDDGRGMNPDLIRRRALQNRIIDEARAESLGEDELFMLTTIPGFSTADEITDLSGRGVGMDIVRTRVENLGGRLSIRSVPRRGTSINLWLPLTVVIVKAFLVRAAARTWAVPISSVRRVAGVSTAAGGSSGGQRMLDVDGEAVPLYSLTELLSGEDDGRGRAAHAARPGWGTALIARGEGRTLAFEVEAVLSQQEVFVRPLGPPLEELLEYTGATVLEDGQIALILDLPNLVRATREPVA